MIEPSRSRLAIAASGVALTALAVVGFGAASGGDPGRLIYVANGELVEHTDSESVEPIALPVALADENPLHIVPSPTADEFAYVCNPDTHELEHNGAGLCTATGERTDLRAESTNLIRFPTWSPDGSQLAYADVAEVGHGSIWITDDAGNAETLCEDWCPLFRYASLAWSPDGATVATVADTPGGDGHPARVVLFDVETHNFRFLNEGSFGLQHDPAWSPDSQHIVYASNDIDGFNLWRANVETGAAEQITFVTGDARNPAFSLDGEQVAFTSWENNTWVLRSVSPDGSGETTLISEADTSRPRFTR